MLARLHSSWWILPYFSSSAMGNPFFVLLFFLFGCFFLVCLAGISCACSFVRILHLVACRVLLWLTPSLVHILCRLSWVIMTQKSTAVIISVNSSLHPIRHKKWKRKWLSYTRHTGMSDTVGLKEVIRALSHLCQFS